MGAGDAFALHGSGLTLSVLLGHLGFAPSAPVGVLALVFAPGDWVPEPSLLALGDHDREADVVR